MNSEGSSDEIRVVLLDNGSLSGESVRQARSLAKLLSARIGRSVEAVSVLHSNRVDPRELDGVPGKIWKDCLEEISSSESRRIAVLPLFFGPSYGLRQARKLGQEFENEEEGRRIQWAEALASPSDDALETILFHDAFQVLDTAGCNRVVGESTGEPAVLLVDHGSPYEEVAACRDRLALNLAKRLGSRVGRVMACSMERREGARYSFNEPLLEIALEEAAKERPSSIVLSRLFLFPGRHAGPGGDIERICAASSWSENGHAIMQTPLLGTNASMIDLLERRYRALEASV